MASNIFAARWTDLLSHPRSATHQSHFVQFYEHDDFLTDSVSLFIGTGLIQGEGALIIATPVHTRDFSRALVAGGFDVDRLQRTGQLLFLDAADTLESFMENGRPNPDKFMEQVGRRVLAANSRFPASRAYGEMVGLLWQEGNVAAVLQLENLWHALVIAERLSLLCGYALDSFTEASAGFQHVCDSHSHVLPAESIIKCKETDDQLRTVADLQRQARLMMLELARRKDVEIALRQSLADHKHTERLLRDSESLRTAIIDSSPDCIHVLDTDARFLFMSRGGLTTMEVGEFAAIQGTDWLRLWKDERAAKNAFDAAKSGRSGEFVAFCPTFQTATPKWWHVIVSPLLDGDGEISRILAISRDVTEIKRIEQQLRQSIETRDEFLCIASHELKTPITSLKMQLEMTKRRIKPAENLMPPPEKLDKVFDICCRQVERLTSLIEDMLDVSRIQAGRLFLNPDRVNLSEIVRDICDRFQHQFSAARCPLELELAEEVVGHWDRNRIEQVVINLVSNALKYAAGSPLQIRTSVRRNSAVLTVKDSGPGISEHKQALIFERFERATSSHHITGLGLGLYIARRIVQAHQGEIRVQSSPGRGAEFIVTLPMLPESPALAGQLSTHPAISDLAHGP